MVSLTETSVNFIRPLVWLTETKYELNVFVQSDYPSLPFLMTNLPSEVSHGISLARGALMKAKTVIEVGSSTALVASVECTSFVC